MFKRSANSKLNLLPVKPFECNLRSSAQSVRHVVLPADETFISFSTFSAVILWFVQTKIVATFFEMILSNFLLGIFISLCLAGSSNGLDMSGLDTDNSGYASFYFCRFADPMLFNSAVV